MQILEEADPPPEEPVEEVLWSGRPEVRPRWPDLVAAGAAGLTTGGVLTVGLGARLDWNLEATAPLGSVYGAIAGLIVLIARIAGASRRATLVCAFWAVVAAASAYTQQRGLTLACPMTLVGALSAYLAARFRQSSGLRYRITATRAQLSEEGRYTLSFPIEAPPRLRTDLFGSALGSVDFGEHEGTLTTRDGRVFKVPPHKRCFRRLLHPQRLMDAWRTAQAKRASE